MSDNNAESKNIRYYVVNYKSNREIGLFAIIKNILSGCVWAIENGFTPLVDMQHNANSYFKDGREFKDNVWEYFFEQPCGVSLSDLNDNSDIVISCLEEDVKYINPVDVLRHINKNKTSYDKFFGLLRFNQETQKYLDENCAKILGGGETRSENNFNNNVLGILCRGTDYINVRPESHPIQPDYKTVIEKAKELQKKFNYEKIYLATEDLNIYNEFKKEFGDLLLDNTQYKYKSTGDKYLNDITIKRENHHYNLAKEYLLSMYILSKCKYFMCGITSGSLGVWLLSKGFINQDYVLVFDLGVYNKEKSKIIYNDFREKILSVRNQYFQSEKYKVLTILGIKLSIKVKRCDEVEYYPNKNK